MLTEDSVLGKASAYTWSATSRARTASRSLFYVVTLSGIWLLDPSGRANLCAAQTGCSEAEAPNAAARDFGPRRAWRRRPPHKRQLKVRYPIVDYREVEIEHFGDITFDKPKSGLSNNQRYTIEYGFGPLPNWFVEVGT